MQVTDALASQEVGPAAVCSSKKEKTPDPVGNATKSVFKEKSERRHNRHTKTVRPKEGRELTVGQGQAAKSVEGVAKCALPIPIERGNLPLRREVIELMDFLSSSPTAWHAVSSAKNLCVEKNGFTQLKENQPWSIVAGGKYFVTRDDSSFIAFVMPKEKPQSACILGAHTDSPGLKLKPNPEKSVDNATLLCPEVYGGPTISTWFDRSLGLAGRINYLNETNKKKSSLIDLGKTIGTISNLAIHLDRELGNKLEVNRQEHLPAICWIHDGKGNPPSHFEEELKKAVPFSKLLSHELFFVPREPAEIVNGNLVHSAKLDNLLGTHASLFALLESQEAEDSRLKMVVCWDHEEVGSDTYKGAASNFLQSVLERMAEGSVMSKDELEAMKANSGLISIDVAHARHPNYFGKHEPNHAPLLGEGPVIKYHANQSYATSSSTEAWIIQAGIETGTPIQKFCVRSDTGCGSTIGNIAAPRLGIRTVDIGAPILGMHSIREKGHLLDHVYMCKLLKTLLSQDLA